MTEQEWERPDGPEPDSNFQAEIGGVNAAGFSEASGLTVEVGPIEHPDGAEENTVARSRISGSTGTSC